MVANRKRNFIRLDCAGNLMLFGDFFRDTGLDWPVVEVSAKWNLHMDQLLSVMFAQWRPTYPPHPSPISPTNPNSRSGLSIPPSIALHSPSHGPETRDTDDDLKLCRTVSMKNPSELKDASSFNKPPKKNSVSINKLLLF